MKMRLDFKFQKASPATAALRRQRWCRQGLAAVGLLQALAGPGVAQAQLPAPSDLPSSRSLPALGDTASEDFPLGTEAKLGQQIMRSIRRDPDYLDDPVLLDHVQSLWQPLLAASRKQGELEVDTDQRFAWEPFLVRDRSVNAFALPGGYVGVHLGLIAVTDTRDELASVLAHEMTHVTQRHIARSIAQGKQQSLISMAAMILGVLATSRSNSNGMGVGEALIVGGQASAMQGSLNFSRDMEREADRIGFSVLTGAGFAPGGMAAMFEKLDKGSRLNDSGAFPYLRSHPLTAARIGEARARLGTSVSSSPVASGSPLEHALMQARARVLMDPRVEALRRWQVLDKELSAPERTAESPIEKLQAAYSAALASTLLREWPRADASLARLASLPRPEARRDARAERPVALLRAQSLLERGDALGAWASLQPLMSQDTSRSLLMATAPVAVGLMAPQASAAAKAAGEPLARRVAEDLQSWVATAPNDAGAWAALSQVLGVSGQPLRALRADAESHFASGDWDGASDRLRAAQRRPRTNDPSDFIELSVIDARLRSIDAQRRQLALENRTY